MRGFLAIGTVLIFGPAFLIAQDQPQSQPSGANSAQLGSKGSSAAQTVVVRRLQLQVNPGCPLTMSAKQGSDGGLVAVAPGQKDEREAKQHEPGQQIRLAISGGKSARVAKATLVVHGLTPRPRMVPLDAVADGPTQSSRRLDASFDENATDLFLEGFTSISSIDVVSLTYSDGTTWKSSPGVCRVVPDPIMLIGAR